MRRGAHVPTAPPRRALDLERLDGMTLPEFLEHTRAYRSDEVWHATARVLERGAPRTRPEFAAFYADVCRELGSEPDPRR